MHLLSHKGLRRAVQYARMSSLAQVPGGEEHRAKQMVDEIIAGKKRGSARRARTVSLAEIAAPGEFSRRSEIAQVSRW